MGYCGDAAISDTGRTCTAPSHLHSANASAAHLLVHLVLDRWEAAGDLHLSMIKITYEYWCDYCDKEIVGADVHHHGADYGRYPVPRGIPRIGSGYACNECVNRAREVLKPSNG